MMTARADRTAAGAVVSTRQPARPVWSLAVVVTAVALIVALPVAMSTGAVEPLLVGDSGPVVRWGLVLVRIVHDVAAAAAVGLLLLAAFLVREGRHTHRRATAARGAAVAAACWALTSAGVLLLGFADFSGLSIDTVGFWQEFGASVWSIELMRLRLLETGLAALLVLVAATARTRGALAWSFALAVLTLAPMAFGGHASGSEGHETAVTSLGLHLLGVTVWFGGLLALIMLRPLLGPALPDTVRRYSVVAGWCYVAVSVGGVLFALETVDDLGDLTSAYWWVLWAKIGAVVLLGGLGAQQRRAVIARGVERPVVFARLALVELAIMATATALGVVVSRTPPPEVLESDVTSPAFALTGYAAPEPFTQGALLTSWQVNWLWLLLAIVAVGLYAAGVLRLHRRGDRWPVLRTLLWVLGWGVFVYTTSGAPAEYGRVMFSMHMVMHMSLMIAVPILLVPAAPITLALRVLPARRDKTLGPRELVLAVVHSRMARIVVNPVVAGAVFFGSLIAFYWTGLFELALTTHSGHSIMVAHFLLAGYAFVASLVGPDPGPPKWPAPLRLMVLLTTLAAHAFFGLALMQGTWLLAPDFFKTLALPWVPDLLADQQLGGGIAWGIGEAPTLILALMVVVDWRRSDEREQRRSDRAAERDGDADLQAYNARLQEMSQPARRSS